MNNNYQKFQKKYIISEMYEQHKNNNNLDYTISTIITTQNIYKLIHETK